MTTELQTVPEYIAGFPRDVQAVLKKVRATIRKAAPKAEEAIKHKIPAYVLDGENLVFFAGYKQHIGVYPLPVGLKKELAGYAVAKGTARFPLTEPIPYPLIEKIVKAHLKERGVAPKLKQAAAPKKKSAPLKAAELPVLGFETPADWRRWLERHHSSARGLWLKIAKKSSGVRSINHKQGVEGALCYGWIDGQGASLDEKHYLVKFTPRGTRSVWSKINRAKALELIEQGAMMPAGQREVERAQQDGRWDAAYDSPRTAAVPDDLAAALDAKPKAKAFFAQLSAANRYAILWRLMTAKKAETRARRLVLFLGMLERGETIH